MASHYLACDLGAESGRVILGTLDGRHLTVEELHRFPTGATRLGDTLRWNHFRIFDEIRQGLAKGGACGSPVDGVSVDSWGVDYVWYHRDQPILATPYHYRDARTEAPYKEIRERLTDARIYGETGIQFMHFNTLYQLADDAANRSGLIALSEGFLNIADHFNYLLSGVARAEVSLASTTQLYNPAKHAWSEDLISAVGLPRQKFPEIVPSGTVLGSLSPALVADTGLSGAKVIAGCSHDTAAAVAAVPAEGDGWAYLSSGTWSLMGVELPGPLLGPEVFAANITNEVGYGHTIRFLKNISGLWLQQECRRHWAACGHNYTYPELERMAMEAEPLRSIINPNEPQFARPGHAPDKIAAACRAHGEPEPRNPGETIRCILESLALIYGATLRTLGHLTRKPVTRLHVVGGGSKSQLLNAATAAATGCQVLAGPTEATALGNIVVQAMALGQISSLAEARAIVRNSFPVQVIPPGGGPDWDAAAERFAQICG